MFDTAGDQLIFGELKQPWAGAGGGAGGDASKVKKGETFPSSKFNKGGDEKGAGGGGGAGGVTILALENIVFGGTGLLTANGGRGGSGENTIYTDHIGGGSGGGSGGHIVLQAKQIDFTQVPNTRIAIEAVGGRGGWGQAQAGSTNAGGAGGPGLIQIHVTPPQRATLLPLWASAITKVSPCG